MRVDPPRRRTPVDWRDAIIAAAVIIIIGLAFIAAQTELAL